jgi:subtilase family serine protease
MGRLACTLFLLIACITVEPSSSTVLFVKHVDGAVDRLLAELESRSDPGSTDYLSWLTRSQVREILEPRPQHIETIKSLTNHHGAVIHSIVGDKVVMSAASAAFVDAVTASGAVDFVSASGAPSVFSTLLPKTRPNRQRASANQTKDTVNAGPQACLASLAGVTPTCIRAAYGLAESSATNAAAHGQAFIVNQGFMSTDISAFQTKYKLPLQPVAHTVGLNDGKAGDEATLDAQYIMSTGQGVPTTYVYLDGSMTNPFTVSTDSDRLDCNY